MQSKDKEQSSVHLAANGGQLASPAIVGSPLANAPSDEGSAPLSLYPKVVAWYSPANPNLVINAAQFPHVLPKNKVGYLPCVLAAHVKTPVTKEAWADEVWARFRDETMRDDLLKPMNIHTVRTFLNVCWAALQTLSGSEPTASGAFPSDESTMAAEGPARKVSEPNKQDNSSSEVSQ